MSKRLFAARAINESARIPGAITEIICAILKDAMAVFAFNPVKRVASANNLTTVTASDCIGRRRIVRGRGSAHAYACAAV